MHFSRSMKLTEGFRDVALKLQEDATALSQRDICSRLSDAVRDIGHDEGDYYCLVDVFGDDKSGDVIYSCNGNLMKAGYEFSTANGKQVAAIDVDNAVDVMPRTSYEEEADDEDHYASMEESFKRDKLYTELPLYERFISKGERDNASAGDFAGKGKSFPILKPGDVMAAVHSMGRAGSSNVGTSTLKANIIRIAKKKGWTKYLPKAWQGDSSESALSAAAAGSIPLKESAATLETIVLKEAKADYEIKLIAPGKGSSAFYPKEVLQRDGPKVFTKGTHVYLNHPTSTEEAERPEGDVKNLAGVLTTDAAYHESHAKGPGLYARMKVFADHAQTVEEKAPHVGMSIRASGKAESKQVKEGLPVLTELTSAESVDVVTHAGAGGMILTEAARESAGSHEEEDMSDTKRLIEAAVQPFYARQRREDARSEVTRLLADVTLPEAAKQRIAERVIEKLDVSKDPDSKALRESVIAEAKAEGEYLASIMPAGMVHGMGIAEVESTVSKKERKALKEARKADKREAIDVFESLGMPKDAAKIAAKGRVA
jgi:hypothetical protein